MSLSWAVAVFFADQAAKLWAAGLNQPKEVIPGLLRIVSFYNPGFLFGLYRVSHLKLLTALISVLVVYLTLSLLRERQPARHPIAVGVGLIWGGMAGNLLDRLLFGAVLDFISLWRIPVFNLADTALTFGAIFVLTAFLFRKN